MAVDQLPTTPGATSAMNGANSVNVNLNMPQPGTINRNSDPIINSMQAPDLVPLTLSKTTTSTNAGAAKTGYFLNEDTYNATPTDNGGGAGTIVNTYNDGWTGLGYNRLAGSVNGGLGILCYGFTMVYTSAGVQSPSGITGANPTLLTASFVGSSQRPSPVPLNAGVNAANYQDGTMTVNKRFYLSAVNQISYNIPINISINLIINTTPDNPQS